MTVPLKELATALDTVLGSFVEYDSHMTPEQRAVAQVTLAALRLARDLAEKGHDPAATIDAIRSAIPEVLAADETVSEAIRQRWPAKT